jgi:hypothetical protein
MQKLIDLVRDYLHSLDPVTGYCAGLGMLALAIAIFVFL